uniref:AB hydrolase-1 domain-containing protein n=1 Tax=Bionectria ochroleuca TaxID=29856 RepID=A0A8H7TNL2_BIOOC
MTTRLRLISGVVLAIAILWVGPRRGSNPIAAETAVPTGRDPALKEDVALLDRAISRPAQVPEAKEAVLLVHGTGMTPEINWDHTLLPPLVQEGFQPYYLEVPKRLFLDIQHNAEYVSYAINKIASEHDARISIISWSAGSLTTQWTLTFFPETRANVKRHISLGGSHRGSWMMVPLYYLRMYSAAVVQQLPWSNFLATLANFGGTRAHVPTTSIGSSTDPFVQPGFYGEGWLGHHDAWRLDGPLAQNIDLFKVCASKRLSDWKLPRPILHDTLLWDPASHKIIFDALRNEKTYVGSADVLESSDCAGGVAPHLGLRSKQAHKDILPELFKFAPTQPPAGWPEVPLREYAQ